MYLRNEALKQLVIIYREVIIFIAIKGPYIIYNGSKKMVALLSQWHFGFKYSRNHEIRMPKMTKEYPNFEVSIVYINYTKIIKKANARSDVYPILLFFNSHPLYFLMWYAFWESPRPRFLHHLAQYHPTRLMGFGEKIQLFICSGYPKIGLLGNI